MVGVVVHRDTSSFIKVNTHFSSSRDIKMTKLWTTKNRMRALFPVVPSREEEEEALAEGARETHRRWREQSSAFVRRLGRGDALFRQKNVDETIREEGRLEEALRRREEKERKKREEASKNEEEEWREKRKTTKKESGNFCGRDVTPRPPLSSSSSSSTKTRDEEDEDESLRKMKEKLDALRREREVKMTRETNRREKEEERRKRRGLVESAQKGRVAENDEEDEKKKREIEKLTRTLDVRLDLRAQMDKRRAMDREHAEEKTKERARVDKLERERIQSEREALRRKREEARELQHARVEVLEANARQKKERRKETV